jgi:hypothetical protein
MRSLICLVITGLFVGIAPVHAGQGRGNANFKVAKSVDNPETADATVRVSVAFSPREVEVIRTHYGPKYSSLPPGLQKKVARGGQLPPGWQRKMEPFPAGLDRILLPLPGNYRRGIYDGQAVIYDPLSHAIYDIVQLVL